MFISSVDFYFIMEIRKFEIVCSVMEIFRFNKKFLSICWTLKGSVSSKDFNFLMNLIMNLLGTLSRVATKDDYVDFS